MSSLTPEASTNVLQAKVMSVEAAQAAEIFQLRAELSKCNEEFQAKLIIELQRSSRKCNTSTWPLEAM